MRRQHFDLAVSLPLLMGLAVACAGRKVPPQTPSGGALVVLVPDAEGATPGRATVTSGSASVELDSAGESTRALKDRPPSQPTVMADADVQQKFGTTLANLPPPAEHFTLYFLLDSDELTAPSKALVPTIIKVVATRPVPEVTIIGHTDTLASAASNYALGLKRATTVRGLLLATGLDPSLVEATSHGEAELLVPTPDGTAEARNRRVEIVIR